MEKRVLLVDDEESVRKLMTRLLVSMGFAVIEARSPSEALQLMSHDVDCLVTDYDMGGETGIDLIHAVRGGVEDWYKHMPILLVTGSGEEVIMRALEAGASAALHKPFLMDELKAALEEILK